MSNCKSDFTSALEYIIPAVIGIFSLFRASQTGGARLQNILRTPTKNKVMVSFTLLWLLSSSKPGSVVAGKLNLRHDTIERLRSWSPLLFFILFLSGVSRELQPERVFSTALVSEAESVVTRQTSGEFLARFLRLETLSQIGFVLIPILDIENRFKRILRRFAPRLLNESETCASCGSISIVLPQLSDACGHVYCYYCAKSEQTPFTCYRCRRKITSFISRS
jgi:hypothetical protein